MVTTTPAPSAPPPSGPEGPAPELSPSERLTAWRARLTWRPAAVGLCLGASVAGAALSYDGVLRGWAWMYPVVVVVLATSAAIAAARLVRARHVVAALVGLVAWALSLCNMFLRDTTLLGVIPTPRTFAGLGDALDEAWNTISFEAVPASPNVGIVALLAGALGLTALIGEAIAVSCRMPAVAGIAPLSVLAVPALLKPAGPGGWGFAVSGAAYLGALALARAEAAGRRGTRSDGAAVSPSRVVAIIAAVVVGALILPTLIPGFSSGSFPEGSRLKYFGQNVGLNPFISLGSDLRSAQGAGIIRYATDSTSPVYLQTTTVDSFDGSTWGPENRDDQRQYGLDAITPETAQAAPVITTTTVIATGNFTSPYLPVPYAPVSVTGVQGRLGWDPLNLSIKGEPGSSLGQNYVVRSVMPNISPEELTAARSAPRGIGRQTSSVPGNVPALVRTTAETVTKDAPSPYAKALAIQAYLRTFTYSEQAPVQQGYDGTGMDVLEKFLEKKSGYCIHFSAAMAVMARLAGIPSRIAVGFAPGHPTGGTVAVAGIGSLPEYVVDARDAHAWPELYFEGLGWVPFEPTPSRGALPAYAQTDSPSGSSTNLDNLNDSLRVSPAPSATAATPTPSATATPAARSGSQAPIAAGVALGVLLVAILLMLPAAIRAGQRRRRLARGIDGAWEELEALGRDHGIPPDPADTPRGYARRLATWEADDGGTLGQALATLTREYERHEYGRPGYQADDDAARAAVATVAQAGQAKSSRLARARIAALPPSAFARRRPVTRRVAQPLRRLFRRPLTRIVGLLRVIRSRTHHNPTIRRKR